MRPSRKPSMRWGARAVLVACVLTNFFWASTGGADTAATVAAPAHACTFGPDPNPVGVSCSTTVGTCGDTTPNAGQDCRLIADCGRAVPQPFDCPVTIGTCGA